MRLLVTGKHGQLGFELQRSLSVLGELFAVDVEDCDLSDAQALRSLIRKVKPDVIVNPAAYTAVDKAESDVATARAINTDAPRVIGEEALAIGAWVVHFSTDYVFEGVGTEPYKETDITHPQNVYGLTKRDGEVALLSTGAKSLIMRTSWVVGAHGGNFAKTMLRLGGERESFNVVADQYGAPTSAALLSDITAQLIGRGQREGVDRFPFGLYHVVASGETNWHQYAQFVIEAAIKTGKPMKATPEQLRPITSAEYPVPAKRPSNSRLDTTLFRQTFGLELPDWKVGLNHVLQQIL